ncbi:MAG: hypothetical protein ACTHOF_14435, partial [Flavisolibacter sp.]
MRGQTLLLISIVIFFSQNCKQVNNVHIPNEKGSSICNLKSKFKYQNLKNFEVDTFGFELRSGHYEEVDSDAFKLIFQQGGRRFIGQGYDRDYYYSWQTRDSNFIEFTILTQDESNYCSLLRYYIFDRKGTLVSKFDLATKCGDADWTFLGKGKQVDKNHFAYQTVECNMQE